MLLVGVGCHSRNERKEIQLFQKDDQNMGFSVRGGLEYGCGIFVTQVLPSSKAAQAGLKVTYPFLYLQHDYKCH